MTMSAKSAEGISDIAKSPIYKPFTFPEYIPATPRDGRRARLGQFTTTSVMSTNQTTIIHLCFGNPLDKVEFRNIIRENST